MNPDLSGVCFQIAETQKRVKSNFPGALVRHVMKIWLLFCHIVSALSPTSRVFVSILRSERDVRVLILLCILKKFDTKICLTLFGLHLHLNI